MISITDRAALALAVKTSIDTRLKALLAKREVQLGEAEDLSQMARFVIIQPGDTIDAVQAELGFSPFENAVDASRFGDPDFMPSWEWILDHGFCFEVVFVFSDAGFGEVLFIDKAAGPFVALCQAFPDPSTADF